MNLDVLGWPHEVKISVPPNECDISIAPLLDGYESKKILDGVLSNLKYSKADFPDRKLLNKGFYWLEKDGLNPILIIGNPSKGNLETILIQNLSNAFLSHSEKFVNRRLWIPLIGAGDGGLSLQTSYSITVTVLREFLLNKVPEVFVTISIPNNSEGKMLYKMLHNTGTSKYEKIGATIIDESEIGSKANTESELEGYNENKPDSLVPVSPENLPRIREALSEPHLKFYFVDFFWSNSSQLKRFIKGKFWEPEIKDQRYSDEVLNVNQGDFLFAKINVESEIKSNSLQVQAIGIVENESNRGDYLNVDWVITEINIELDFEKSYFDLIQNATIEDAESVFLSLGLNFDFKRIYGEVSSTTTSTATATTTTTTRPPEFKIETIAGLLSDSESGEDYLDITHDVNAFARVMAAKSFQPPLAIALFGKWGSGKSFFMSKLKEQIAFISGRDDNGVFCNGVVQIHFNAWSYMDSNLWASLVSKIFEELNFYIRDFTKTEEEKKEVENHLKSSLSIAKEEFGILNNQKKSLENQIKTLKVKKEEIEKILNDDITEIEKKTIWDVIEKVDDEFKSKEKIVEALHENESFLDSQEKLKKIVPEKYWEDPRKTYDLIKSKSVFFKLFFRPGLFQNNLLWLGLIILFVVSMGLFHWFFPWWLKNENFVIPEAVLSFLGIAGICWKRAENVFKTLQPLVVSFWDIKESYQTEITKAKSKFIQEEKALKLKIEKSKAELIQLEKQIQSVENTKADLEFRIENALATEALYSFIDRRSKSDDYKKHLGLISVIRKDFEVLNGLFLDHQEESGSQKSSNGFRERFKKPLERIILYIDDLDRCPEENVVQVLEAVNLLMAFPLFVVVVGVDARWVKNALIKKHSLQFGFAGVSGNGEESKNFEKLEPSNYLEKIFQIPFQLKSATDSNVKNMIENLAQSKAKVSVESPKFENLELDDQVVDPTEELQNTTKSKPQIKKDKVVGDHPIGEVRKNEEKTIKVPTKIEIKPEALVIGSDEVGLMREMSVIIGKNPRAIKRFVNIYRIIKAHEGFDNGDIIEDEDLLAVLFLIALPLGIFRELTPGIEEYVFSKNNWDSEFGDYFDFHALDIETKISLMKKQLFEIINGSEELLSLVEVENSTFRKHFDFIKRFSFSHL